MVMFHSYVTYVSLPEGSNPKQLFVLKLIIEGNMLLLFETAQLRYFPKKRYFQYVNGKWRCCTKAIELGV